MIMRWTGITLAVFALGLITWSIDRLDPGGPAETSFEAIFVATAAAQDFRQRHESHGVDCSGCHWIELDYSTVPGTSQCLACHGSHDAVAALTANLIPNPHHSHMGEAPCSDCHSEHGESRLSCNQCHVFELDMP